ncbi:MAG: galM 1 [Marmoricola sp.]|nr:galM 1 [Marmoricola sp.]
MDDLSSRPFGDGSVGPVQVLTIGATPGVVLEVLDLGATVHALHVTGGDGARRNVVLGHPGPDDHRGSTHFLGGTIGRYANRIRDGRFELDGSTVGVATNDRGNALHGGPDGFDQRTWTVEEHTADVLVLGLLSPDGDQGFPGALSVRVRFTVGDTSVRLDLEATTDAPTPVNLTSHAYWNLTGEGSGTVDDHTLQVGADRWEPVDATGIPLGDPQPVAGTPFDLRQPRRLGDLVRDPHPQVRAAAGLDHDLVLSGSGWRRAATLAAPSVATAMELWTDQPALQVYTGNALDGTVPSTQGRSYRQGDGIALEPQLPPDSPNRRDLAEAAVLRPGTTYAAAIEWRFGTC